MAKKNKTAPSVDPVEPVEPVAEVEAPEVAEDATPVVSDVTDRVLCGSITSKRGVLVRGTAVRASDFRGGNETFNELKRKGLVGLK